MWMRERKQTCHGAELNRHTWRCCLHLCRTHHISRPFSRTTTTNRQQLSQPKYSSENRLWFDLFWCLISPDRNPGAESPDAHFEIKPMKIRVSLYRVHSTAVIYGDVNIFINKFRHTSETIRFSHLVSIAESWRSFESFNKVFLKGVQSQPRESSASTFPSLTNPWKDVWHVLVVVLSYTALRSVKMVNLAMTVALRQLSLLIPRVDWITWNKYRIGLNSCDILNF
jgi:hypothetical protein